MYRLYIFDMMGYMIFRLMKMQFLWKTAFFILYCITIN